MEQATSAPETSANTWQDITRFHLEGPAADAPGPPDAVLPSLIVPYLSADTLRFDYPLVLDAAATGVKTLVRPMFDALWAEVEAIDPSQSKRVLRDNVARLERQVHRALEGATGPVDSRAALARASQAMIAELSLENSSADDLRADLAQLTARLGDTRLLPYGPTAGWSLLAFTINWERRRRSATFRVRLEGLIRGVVSKLEVEERSGSHGNGKANGSGLGGVSHLIDTSALSRLPGRRRGGLAMSPERRQRLLDAVQLLKGASDTINAAPITVVVPQGEAPLLPDDANWSVVERPAPCEAALEVFAEAATGVARVFRAVRTAELELEQSGDLTAADAWLDRFDWTAFSRDELLLVPPVVAFETLRNLATGGMASLSRLILSGRPIHVVVPVRPAANPAASDWTFGGGYRLEAGQMGISHRVGFVQQSSTARPLHLVEGLVKGLRHTGAALHLVAVSSVERGKRALVGGLMCANAAIEARAWALFHYDPAAGGSWARRLSVHGNPQPEADWSVSSDTGDAFTFADYALLIRNLRPHLTSLEGVEAPDGGLVPVSEMLAEPEDRPGRVPYVVGLDRDGGAHKLAVSRALLLACRDRMGAWHALRELAGIRNELAEQASLAAREQAEQAFQHKLAQLEAEHTAAISAARTEAAGGAMRRLAEALVSGKVSSMASGTVVAWTTPLSPAAPAAPESTPAVGEPAAAQAAVEDDEDLEIPADPWIDTPLCTTCNDCMAINAQVFIYDQNQQAIIGDANAGTFEEIVEAAEKCPAKCIHPGQPKNPDEPGMADLIERAAKFN